MLPIPNTSPLNHQCCNTIKKRCRTQNIFNREFLGKCNDHMREHRQSEEIEAFQQVLSMALLLARLTHTLTLKA
jgi:hypothetical protein